MGHILIIGLPDDAATRLTDAPTPRQGRPAVVHRPAAGTGAPPYETARASRLARSSRLATASSSRVMSARASRIWRRRHSPMSDHRLRPGSRGPHDHLASVGSAPRGADEPPVLEPPDEPGGLLRALAQQFGELADPDPVARDHDHEQTVLNH